MNSRALGQDSSLPTGTLHLDTDSWSQHHVSGVVHIVGENNSPSHSQFQRLRYFSRNDLWGFSSRMLALLKSQIKAYQTLCKTLTYYPDIGINHSPGPEIQCILPKGCKVFRMHYSEICKSHGHQLGNLLDMLHVTESLQSTLMVWRPSRAAF